jgi:hypothetical protein
MTPGFKEFLDRDECKEALRLWRDGNDTNQIARQMNATEAAVYNGLHEIRKDFRQLSETAAKFGLKLERVEA